MSTIIESIEQRQLRRDIPRFKAGDTVRVHFQVIEGQRRRVQVFEGIVIKRQGAGVRETFTVRKVSFGVGVERTFPVHSPIIQKIEVERIGDVRRAKLYYLRGRVGKRVPVSVAVMGQRQARQQSQQPTGEQPQPDQTGSLGQLHPESVSKGETSKVKRQSQPPCGMSPAARRTTMLSGGVTNPVR